MYSPEAECRLEELLSTYRNFLGTRDSRHLLTAYGHFLAISDLIKEPGSHNDTEILSIIRDLESGFLTLLDASAGPSTRFLQTMSQEVANFYQTCTVMLRKRALAAPFDAALSIIEFLLTHKSDGLDETMFHIIVSLRDSRSPFHLRNSYHSINGCSLSTSLLDIWFCYSNNFDRGPDKNHENLRNLRNVIMTTRKKWIIYFLEELIKEFQNEHPETSIKINHILFLLDKLGLGVLHSETGERGYAQHVRYLLDRPALNKQQIKDARAGLYNLASAFYARFNFSPGTCAKSDEEERTKSAMTAMKSNGLRSKGIFGRAGIGRAMMVYYHAGMIPLGTALAMRKRFC